jgi:hypothetical protein
MGPRHPGGKDSAQPGDPALALCLSWLRARSRAEIQLDRWSRLESELIHRQAWLQLSEEERKASPFTAEFDKIEARLDVLHGRQRLIMADILSQPSHDIRGTYAKVSVLERILSLDESTEIYQLVAAVMAELATWRPELKDQPLYKTSDRYRRALSDRFET